MDKLPEHYEPEVEEKPKYTPRPKGQLILAWTLIAVVVAGVLLQFYWMMNT
ncbi:MAG: hypothetical protein R3Y62_08750 [Eubacteriales bacterium]